MIYDYKGDEVKTSSITERDYHCSFALFQRIGVLGDSYANGNFGENPSATNDVGHPSLSWAQQLARRQGVQVYNFSVGGQSTRSFLTNTGDTGMSALENSPACGLYILALERNDYNYEKNGHDGYIGDITDITGHSYGSYPDTFYGNYATIIERILLHAPNARFVVMVGDYSSSNVLGTAYNNAMIEIAEHYSIPYMEQLSDQYFLGSNSYYRDKSPAGHPAPYAYSGMELAIERLFDKCLKENKEYFMYYLGVQLTDKEKTANKFDINVLAGNFAPIEVSPSQNPYSVGDRLVYNGLLYTVTSAIAVDDLLVVGTNIERKTVDDAISDISASFIGVIMWWTGTTLNIPNNAKICNGQAVSRTTYAELFSIIGTAYGAGDGSTTFNLPDLRVEYDDYGRFIRARFTDTMNNKQIDAIRNIKGNLTKSAYGESLESTSKGSIYSLAQGSTKSNASSWVAGLTLCIDANRGTESDNPMAGHAVATDSDGGIRPYNISMIPIIFVK